MKKRVAALLALFVVALAYAHGCRLIDLSDVPSSKRPWDMYLTVGYGEKHLSKIEDISGEMN